MKIGPVTQSLIKCFDGVKIDNKKFFAKNPYNVHLEKSLYELQRKGFLLVDEGDDRIVEIAPTEAFSELVMAIRK